MSKSAMFRHLMISITLLTSLACTAAGETAEKDIEWLFVQNARAATLADGVLTLEGVSPTTVFFSDRPERQAAHGLTSEFVTFWSTGGGSDNFKKDPPNATLSIVTEETADDVVVTLSNPMLDGDTLRYDVTIIDGRDQVEGGPASLFVDVVGMPLTPVSYAGVRRRTVRRVAY